MKMMELCAQLFGMCGAGIGCAAGMYMQDYEMALFMLAAFVFSANLPKLINLRKI